MVCFLFANPFRFAFSLECWECVARVNVVKMYDGMLFGNHSAGDEIPFLLMSFHIKFVILFCNRQLFCGLVQCMYAIQLTPIVTIYFTVASVVLHWYIFILFDYYYPSDVSKAYYWTLSMYLRLCFNFQIIVLFLIHWL